MKASDRVIRALLRSPVHRLLPRSLALLTYCGRRSGELREIPVMCAVDGERLIVLAADPRRKRWWHNFEGDPRPATLRLDGLTRDLCGRVLPAGDEADAARRVYVARFPRAAAAAEEAVVVEFAAA